MPYVTADRNLPRSLDVQISLSRPQAETRTELDVLCVACENLGLLPGPDRVRFYSSLEAVEDDFVAGTEAHFAASAFFAQSPRAPTLALGEVFLEDLPAQLASLAFTAADVAALALVADGAMDVVYNPDGGSAASELNLTALDFSGAADLADVAAVLDAVVAPDLTAEVKTLPGGDEVLVLRTVAVGDGVTISFPADPGSGTYVGDLLKLTAAEGAQRLLGHTFVDLADELSSVQNAAAASARYLYGWALGATLRDVALQTNAAAWALGRTVVLGLTTNDLTALSPAFDADVGSVVQATGNRRTFCVYHDNPQRYPEVSILAYMLSVNYQLQDATVTAKFKQLPGVETVQLTESEWSALQAKGYNTYTAIGNSARTFRDGVASDAGWYLDTVINLDNFVEDLSVNVFNVFLRNRKVPYTARGQAFLVDACQDTGNQYEYNGTFAAREVADSTRKGGTRLVPAVQVLPTPPSNMSAADRAARIGPPIEMIVQEAGAIHSVAINVEVVS